jgi:hypothetical protein
MTSGALVTFTLSLHTSLLVAGLTAYYKYGDRTDVFEKSLKGTETALAQLRRRIAYQLGLRLKPVFDNPESVVNVGLVDSFGNPMEVAVSPAGSESYNDALFDFVDSHVEELLDWRALMVLRRRWCAWARFLSWAILAFVLMEGGIASVLTFQAEYKAAPLPMWLLDDSFIASVLFIFVLIFVPVGMLLHFHDSITEYRTRYAAQ